MPKMSLTGLVKFMTAGHAGQWKVLQDFKFPKTPEPVAMALYYKDTLTRIKAFHDRAYPPQWLREQSQALLEEARFQQGQTAQRTRENARAVQQYCDFIGARKFKIIKSLRLKTHYSGVTISVVPDLFVLEGKQQKLFKFNFGKVEPSDIASWP